MKRLFFRTGIAVLGFGSFYLSSSQNVRADDWGCQVLLCLSNPGGPTEFADCRPSIDKLWRWLAKGRAFPTCSGAGFRSAQPRYEPLYCSKDYRLTHVNGPRGRSATCVSASLQVVDSALCQRNLGGESASNGLGSSIRWQWDNGHQRCMAYTYSRPLAREKPRYIDVTIDGVGSQRVWF